MTTKNNKELKGPPVTFRTKQWEHRVCEYFSKKYSKQTGINTKIVEVKKSMFSLGLKVYCEEKGYPSTKEDWDKIFEEQSSTVVT